VIWAQAAAGVLDHDMRSRLAAAGLGLMVGARRRSVRQRLRGHSADAKGQDRDCGQNQLFHQDLHSGEPSASRIRAERASLQIWAICPQRIMNCTRKRHA
jgi:hypothetical protein